MDLDNTGPEAAANAGEVPVPTPMADAMRPNAALIKALKPLTDQDAWAHPAIAARNIQHILRYLCDRISRIDLFSEATSPDHSKLSWPVAVALWTMHAHEWNTSISSLTVSDILFLCVCCHHVLGKSSAQFAASKDAVTKPNGIKIQTTFDTLRRMAWNARHQEISDDQVAVMFDMCAKIVVFGFLDEQQDAGELCAAGYQMRRNPFATSESSLGDVDNTRKKKEKEERIAADKQMKAQIRKVALAADAMHGETEEEQKEDIEEEQRIQREGAIAELQAKFVPWCTRVFFHLGFHSIVLHAPFKSRGPEDTANRYQELIKWGRTPNNHRRWRSNFETWMSKFAAMKATDRFKTPFRDFCFMSETAIGSGWMRMRSNNLNQRELQPYQEVFHDEAETEKQSETMTNDIDMDIREMWNGVQTSTEVSSSSSSSSSSKILPDHKDQKQHPLRQHFAFYQFCHIMKTQLKIDMLTDYVRLEPELLGCFKDWLHALELHGHERRPRIVEVRGRIRVLHRRYYYDCDDRIDAILLWLLIVLRYFNGRLESGHMIYNEKYAFVIKEILT